MLRQFLFQLFVIHLERKGTRIENDRSFCCCSKRLVLLCSQQGKKKISLIDDVILFNFHSDFFTITKFGQLLCYYV